MLVAISHVVTDWSYQALSESRDSCWDDVNRRVPVLCTRPLDLYNPFVPMLPLTETSSLRIF